MLRLLERVAEIEVQQQRAKWVVQRGVPTAVKLRMRARSWDGSSTTFRRRGGRMESPPVRV